MDFSIIIVNFNTRDLLTDCLHSVYSQKGTDFEVWVVDNASSDGSCDMVKKNFPQVHLLENQENFGFAKANNLALRHAQGKFLFLLNSDTMLKGQPLAKISRFLKDHPQAGVVGVRVLNPDGTPQRSVGKFYNLINAFLMLVGGERMGFLRRSPSEIKEADWVSGAAFVVRKEILEKVGLFDENVFMYMEEVEWCYRIKKAGFKILFYPEAEIVHYVRGSSSKSEAIWGIYRGLIYFYQKHMPVWQLVILRMMLKTKALFAWSLGVLVNNRYLKTTYAKAYRLV